MLIGLNQQRSGIDRINSAFKGTRTSMRGPSPSQYVVPFVPSGQDLVERMKHVGHVTANASPCRVQQQGYRDPAPVKLHLIGNRPIRTGSSPTPRNVETDRALRKPRGISMAESNTRVQVTPPAADAQRRNAYQGRGRKQGNALPRNSKATKKRIKREGARSNAAAAAIVADLNDARAELHAVADVVREKAAELRDVQAELAIQSAQAKPARPKLARASVAAQAGDGGGLLDARNCTAECLTLCSLSLRVDDNITVNVGLRVVSEAATQAEAVRDTVVIDIDGPGDKYERTKFGDGSLHRRTIDRIIAVNSGSESGADWLSCERAAQLALRTWILCVITACHVWAFGMTHADVLLMASPIVAALAGLMYLASCGPRVHDSEEEYDVGADSDVRALAHTYQYRVARPRVVRRVVTAWGFYRSYFVLPLISNTIAERFSGKAYHGPTAATNAQALVQTMNVDQRVVFSILSATLATLPYVCAAGAVQTTLTARLIGWYQGVVATRLGF